MPRPRPLAKVPGMSSLPAAPITKREYAVPDEAELFAIGLKQEEFPRFIKAMQICLMQMEGKTVQEACDAVGIHINTTYGRPMQEMLAKARKFTTHQLMHNVNVAKGVVYERWPHIIRGIVGIAENGAEDKDKISATELLYSMFLANSGDSVDYEVNEQQNHNFAPFQIINEAGSTVNFISPPVQPALPEPLIIEDLSGQTAVD